LFWHARPFAIRLSSAIVFDVVKSLISALPVYWFNLFAGFSGQNPADDLPTATYDVNMTTIAVAFFVVCTYDVDNAKYNHSEA